MPFFALSQGVEKSLIAGAALVAGALFTFVASVFTARSKIRQVELTYSQKLHESYLATARLYTNSVYVPLNIALGRFSRAYFAFRDEIKKVDDANPTAVQVFSEASTAFLGEIESFRERGSDAFVTSGLEGLLLSFTTFLQKSLSATSPRTAVVFLGETFHVGRRGRSAVVAAEVALTAVRTLTPAVPLKPPRVKQLLEAPITSAEFEERVVADLQAMKALIKEVTLGVQTNPL